MALTINGASILELQITEERVGTWHATIEADSEDDITGEVTLDIEGETFIGTVQQGDVDSSRWKGLVFGGKGGVSKTVGASYYYTPTVRTVLEDLARDSGETLSVEIDPLLYAKRFERFCRLEGPAHTQFRQLADELEIDWRITRAGELWFGQETWLPITAKTISGEYNPELRLLEVAYDEDDDRPVFRPGVTFEGKKVQRVVTHASAKALRQYVFFDAEKGDSGLVAMIRRLVRELVWPKLQLARVHGARVTEQAADGTVSIAIDDAAIGGKFKGLNHVPLVLGLPGATIKATSATRLRFFWDSGRPTKPQAGHFDQGTPVGEIAFKVGEDFKVDAGELLELLAANGVIGVEADLKLGGSAATKHVALAEPEDARWQALLAAVAAAAVTETGASGLSGMNALNSLLTAPPASLALAAPIGATKVKAL